MIPFNLDPFGVALEEDGSVLAQLKITQDQIGVGQNLRLKPLWIWFGSCSAMLDG